MSARYRIGNRDVDIPKALDGQYYKGLTKADISRILDDIPVIDDIAQTVDWLRDNGISSVVCTLAWKFVGEVFAERYGFIASSGPTLKTDQNGVFTGEVESDFTEHDKPVFVSSLCKDLGISMSEVFHIGDSRSDIPLFRAVGFSVALNANQQAKETAKTALETDSLFDVLHAIPGLKSSIIGVRDTFCSSSLRKYSLIAPVAEVMK